MPPGYQAPYPPAGYPAPPRKRRRWPWILGGVFLLFVVIGIANGGSNPSTASGASVPDTAGSGAPSSVELAFGTPHRWDNEEIVISAPGKHTEGNMFLQPDEGNRYIKFDVTIRNIGGQDRDVIGTEITVQHAGRAAQEAYLAGSDVLTQGRIPPGGEITFTRIYQISATPGELRVSARPDFLASTTAYYVGQV